MVKPTQAFILAAGFGTRLRPYTERVPKPMVEVDGRSLIWRILDRLREVGVYDVVVNGHYLADALDAHLQEYMVAFPQMVITFSHEDEILDTGGGVRKVLSHFKDAAPFYVIAGDALWEDEAPGILEVLAQQWDAEKMDILTWMQPVERMELTRGVGDYDVRGDGFVERSLDQSGTHMWTNVRLNVPEIYKSSPEGAFSFLPILDACQQAGRLHVVEYDGGLWHHISTPDDLHNVEKHFREKKSEGGE